MKTSRAQIQNHCCRSALGQPLAETVLLILLAGCASQKHTEPAETFDQEAIGHQLQYTDPALEADVCFAAAKGTAGSSDCCGGLLCGNFDIVDTTGGRRNRSIVGSQPRQVKLYRLSYHSFRLFHGGAGSNATWQVRNVCGVIVTGILNNYCISHINLTIFSVLPV